MGGEVTMGSHTDELLPLHLWKCKCQGSVSTRPAHVRAPMRRRAPDQAIQQSPAVTVRQRGARARAGARRVCAWARIRISAIWRQKVHKSSPAAGMRCCFISALWIC